MYPKISVLEGIPNGINVVGIPIIVIERKTHLYSRNYRRKGSVRRAARSAETRSRRAGNDTISCRHVSTNILHHSAQTGMFAAMRNSNEVRLRTSNSFAEIGSPQSERQPFQLHTVIQSKAKRNRHFASCARGGSLKLSDMKYCGTGARATYMLQATLPPEWGLLAKARKP